MKIPDSIRNTPSAIAWRKFKKNPLAVTGLVIILLSIILAGLGYTICPDKSPSANTQHLELAARKPGFKVKMLKVRKNENIPASGFLHTMMFGKLSKYEELPILNYSISGPELTAQLFTDFPEKEKFCKTYNLCEILFPLSGEVSFTKGISNDSLRFRLITGEELSASVADLESRVNSQSVYERRYYLGTDRFGRDMLSRLILGARISLMVGFIAVLISLIIGISMGAVAGYYRGRTDKVIMWIINVIWSVPTLLLVIALTMVIGKGFWQVFVAVGVSMWVEVARIVRAQVLSLREKEFIDSAKVLGYSDFRILLKHIVPNILSPVIIISAANFASAILIEAGLSFLGIGVQPPMASWGGMVKDHYGFILAGKAYLAFIPGFAIMIMVLAFTILGNGLRDAFDIRKE